MNIKRILVTTFTTMGLASCAFGASEPKSDFKREDKAARAAFKQQLKDQRVDCRRHPHTVACNDLKERQKMEKRQFRTAEKAAKAGDPKDLSRNWQ